MCSHYGMKEDSESVKEGRVCTYIVTFSDEISHNIATYEARRAQNENIALSNIHVS